MDKKLLRAKMTIVRKGIKNKAHKDSIIFKKVCDFIDNAGFVKIFSYVSLPDEVDTFKIIEYYIHNRTFEVYVPRTESMNMSLVKLQNAVYEEADRFGNIESVKNAPVFEGNADIALVPLLAFNSNLYRLGYGGGCYDKYLLNHKVFSIGLAYDEQYTDEFRAESFDMPLDMVITPSKIFKNKSGREY